MDSNELGGSTSQGIDCRELFKEAYENRYAWDSDFQGYVGKCIWKRNI